jgi:hypothetical protein
LYYTHPFVQREQTTTEELVGFRYSRQRMTGRTGRLANGVISHSCILVLLLLIYTWSPRFFFGSFPCGCASGLPIPSVSMQGRFSQATTGGITPRIITCIPEHSTIPRLSIDTSRERLTNASQRDNKSLMLGVRVRVGVTLSPTISATRSINLASRSFDLCQLTWSFGGPVYHYQYSWGVHCMLG